MVSLGIGMSNRPMTSGSSEAFDMTMMRTTFLTAIVAGPEPA